MKAQVEGGAKSRVMIETQETHKAHHNTSSEKSPETHKVGSEIKKKFQIRMKDPSPTHQRGHKVGRSVPGLEKARGTGNQKTSERLPKRMRATNTARKHPSQ